VLKHIKARVLVSDVRGEKLEAARELGVPEEDIVPIHIQQQGRIAEWITGRGVSVDTVLEFVGKKQTFADAQKVVRAGGKVLCIGTGERVNALDMKNGIRKRLSFIFSYGGQYRDLEEVLALIKEGVLRPRVRRGVLRDFPRYLKELGEGGIEDRVALIP
jgi:propanol-preferring alcohol dehydrogenase